MRRLSPYFVAFLAALAVLSFAGIALAQDDDPTADWPFDVSVSIDHDRLVTGQETMLRWSFDRGRENVASCAVYVQEQGGEPIEQGRAKSNIWANMSQKVVMPGTSDVAAWVQCESKPDIVQANGQPWSIGFHRGIEWLDAAEVAADPPSCFPKPIGRGTWPVRRTINAGKPDVGECAAWWCPGAQAIEPAGFCWYWRELAPERTVAWVLGLTDETAASEWRGYSGWKSLAVDERKLLLEATLEAKPAYTVRPRSSYPDRAAYGRKPDGTRNWRSVGWVAVGAPCDCTVGLGPVGPGYWCDVSQNLDIRTGEPLPAFSEDGSGGAFTQCVVP